jgi:hypothetical protein
MVETNYKFSDDFKMTIYETKLVFHLLQDRHHRCMCANYTGSELLP